MAEQTAAKEVTPVAFFEDGPFGFAGNMVKKDFSTKTEPVATDDADDTDAPDGDLTPEDDGGGTDTDDDNAPPTDATTGEDDDTSEVGDPTVTTTPQVPRDSVDYEAQQKSDKSIEDVDAPVLNGTDDDEDTLEL